jgi:glyoxylase-like metal-dependent hydrolase (beta-lactamase superfamily II)
MDRKKASQSMMHIQEFFDPATFTLTYVVSDSVTKDAVVLDPVLDYDPASSQVSEDSAAKLLQFLKDQALKVHFILETHAHADHLSGAQVIKRQYPTAKTAIGARIVEVQKVFKPIFDLPASFLTDGSQFDRLLRHGEKVPAGSLEFEVRYTPGHTPACASYRFGDALFTGDALFIPDLGVGRCDFPAASAEVLYDSVKEQIYTLPDSTRVFSGHDYPPANRGLRFQSTVGEHKQSNIHIRAETSKEGFVKFRTERDKTLAAPRLLLPSIQINIDAGRLPAPHTNGKHYLSIPISKKS